MTTLRELRWAIGQTLLGWGFDLINREASDDAIRAFATLWASIKDPKPEFRTIPVRSKRGRL